MPIFANQPRLAMFRWPCVAPAPKGGAIAMTAFSQANGGRPRGGLRFAPSRNDTSDVDRSRDLDRSRTQCDAGCIGVGGDMLESQDGIIWSIISTGPFPEARSRISPVSGRRHHPSQSRLLDIRNGRHARRIHEDMDAFRGYRMIFGDAPPRSHFGTWA
jgi:hypothetical protein